MIWGEFTHYFRFNTHVLETKNPQEKVPSPLPLAESLQLEAVEVPQAGFFSLCFPKNRQCPKNGW